MSCRVSASVDAAACVSRSGAAGALPKLAILLVIGALGGCAATEKPQGVAGPSVREPSVAKVEIEEDGFPVQVLPRRAHFIPDDPSEPWSPNYGNGRADAPATRVMPDKPASAQTRTNATVAQLSPALDPDEIIRRAIAEHEMRQR